VTFVRSTNVGVYLSSYRNSFTRSRSRIAFLSWRLLNAFFNAGIVSLVR